MYVVSNCYIHILEIRDHPFLMGTSLEEFQSKYPGKTVSKFGVVYLLVAVIIVVVSVHRKCHYGTRLQKVGHKNSLQLRDGKL